MKNSPTTDSSVKPACAASDAKCSEGAAALQEVVVWARKGLAEVTSSVLGAMTAGISRSQIADCSASQQRAQQAQTPGQANAPQDPSAPSKPKRGKQRLEDWMILVPAFMLDSIVDDLTESWPDSAYYGLQAGTFWVGPGKWRQAAKSTATIVGRSVGAREAMWSGKKISNELAETLGVGRKELGRAVEKIKQG